MNPLEDELMLDDFVLLDHVDGSERTEPSLLSNVFTTQVSSLSSNLLGGIKRLGSRLFYTPGKRTTPAVTSKPRSQFAEHAVGPVRILVLGKKGVGKTSLIKRLVGDDFTHRYCSPIYNIQAFTKIIHVKKKDNTFQSVCIQFYEIEDMAESPELIVAHLFDQIVKIEIMPEAVSLVPSITNVINGVLMVIDSFQPDQERERLFYHYVKYSEAAYCDNQIIFVPMKYHKADYNYPDLCAFPSTLGIVYQVYFDSLCRDDSIQDISDLMIQPDINIFVYLSIKLFFKKKKQYHASIQPYPCPYHSVHNSPASNHSSPSSKEVSPLTEPSPSPMVKSFQVNSEPMKEITLLVVGSLQSGKTTLVNWILGDQTLAEPDPVIKTMNSIMFEPKKLEKQTVVKRLFSQLEYKLSVIEIPGSVTTTNFTNILLDPKCKFDGYVFMLDQSDLEFSFSTVSHLIIYAEVIQPDVKLYMIKNKFDIVETMGTNEVLEREIVEFALKYNVAYLEKFTFKSKEGLLVLNNLFLNMIREKVEA
jgi:GTPase SAR1 family protein